MRSLVAAGTLLALCLVRAQPADACSLAAPHEEFRPVEGTVSPEPPSAPRVLAVNVHRNAEDACEEDSACDGLGSIAIELEATDDTGPVGFRFELIDGTLPTSVVLPEGPVQPVGGSGDAIFFHFHDNGSPFDGRVSITTVDLAGNESLTTTEIEIADGRQGCTAAGRAATGTLLPVLLALALVRCRRRPRASVS